MDEIFTVVLPCALSLLIVLFTFLYWNHSNNGMKEDDFSEDQKYFKEPAMKHVPKPKNAPIVVKRNEVEDMCSQHPSLFLYPVIWQGNLSLKNDQAAVKMHFVAGNPNVARASLPHMDGDSARLRIAQRMRLDQTQLDDVSRKLMIRDECCILLALPCGKDENDVIQQSNYLKTGFIDYFLSKDAAGIVSVSNSDSLLPTFVVHIFPSCDYTTSLLRTVPDLLWHVTGINHLVIIIYLL